MGIGFIWIYSVFEELENQCMKSTIDYYFYLYLNRFRLGLFVPRLKRRRTEIVCATTHWHITRYMLCMHICARIHVISNIIYTHTCVCGNGGGLLMSMVMCVSSMLFHCAKSALLIISLFSSSLCILAIPFYLLFALFSIQFNSIQSFRKKPSSAVFVVQRFCAVVAISGIFS